jgi:hypothetical protein
MHWPTKERQITEQGIVSSMKYNWLLLKELKFKLQALKELRHKKKDEKIENGNEKQKQK